MNERWRVPAARAISAEDEARLRLVTHTMYALHTLSWFSLGLFSVVAMVLNHVKRSELPNRLYVSHFRWQARTFWFTLLWLVGTAPLWLLFVFPGYVAWSLIGLWYLYRCTRGWWDFYDKRAMPQPALAPSAPPAPLAPYSPFSPSAPSAPPSLFPSTAADDPGTDLKGLPP